MSESEDSGPGRREVAHRLFAAEFDDSEFSYSESDEERAPNYVVTPTGARVNRLFAVGVLTELEQVNEEVLRARVVDPTGPFVVYAGQYQPEALAFLEAAEPPMFVAVTGKARTFEPEDSDRVFTSIRPESISEVDAETRDRWVVKAAEQTINRVARTASAKQSGLSGDELQRALVDAGAVESDAAGTALALDYYGTTGEYLQGVRELALDCVRVVAGERDEAGTLSLAPGDGTDAPLSALATMAIDAPTDTETPAAESTASEPVTTTPTESDSSSAEPADSETETATATSTASDSSEGETSTTTEPSDTEISATTEPSTEATAESATAGESSTSESEPEATEPTSGEEPSKVEKSETPSEPAGETGTDDDTATDTSETLGDFDDDETTADDDGAADDDVGDFDTEFELDEDEREEIEQEYGTDFQSGTEVDEAGEADIDTPDPEELAEMEADAATDDGSEAPAATSTSDSETTTETAASASDGEAASEAESTAGAESASDSEPTADAEPEDDGAPDPEDVDLEDAVMAAMKDLDDGGGADREAVVSEVVEQYGADRDAVADAIQDALMGGRCYEPDDGKLTPI